MPNLRDAVPAGVTPVASHRLGAQPGFGTSFPGVAVLGDNGQHARSAVGFGSLESEVVVDHHLDEFVEADLGFPTEHGLGLG